MKNISLLFTALLFFSSAQAQFGDLLNKFKSEVDKTQSARPAPAPAAAPAQDVTNCQLGHLRARPPFR